MTTEIVIKQKCKDAWDARVISQAYPEESWRIMNWYVKDGWNDEIHQAVLKLGFKVNVFEANVWITWDESMIL